MTIYTKTESAMANAINRRVDSVLELYYSRKITSKMMDNIISTCEERLALIIKEGTERTQH